MPTLYERYLAIREQNPELPELGHNSLGNIGKHIKREMLKRIPEWNPEKTTMVDSSGETLTVVLYPEKLTDALDMCIKEFYRRISLGKKPPPAPIQVPAPPESKKSKNPKTDFPKSLQFEKVKLKSLKSARRCMRWEVTYNNKKSKKMNMSKEPYKVIATKFLGEARGLYTYEITFNQSLVHTGRTTGIEDGLNAYRAKEIEEEEKEILEAADKIRAKYNMPINNL